jgi:TRAP-type mannitol/chloroaromatic compound transport system substrate-binding protein
MLSDYTAKNNLALQYLKSKNIVIKEFPSEIMNKLRYISKQVMKEISTHDSITKEIYVSYNNFQKNVSPWTEITDKSFLNIR